MVGQATTTCLGNLWDPPCQKWKWETSPVEMGLGLSPFNLRKLGQSWGWDFLLSWNNQTTTFDNSATITVAGMALKNSEMSGRESEDFPLAIASLSSSATRRFENKSPNFAKMGQRSTNIGCFFTMSLKFGQKSRPGILKRPNFFKFSRVNFMRFYYKM